MNLLFNIFTPSPPTSSLESHSTLFNAHSSYLSMQNLLWIAQHLYRMRGCFGVELSGKVIISAILGEKGCSKFFFDFTIQWCLLTEFVLLFYPCGSLELSVMVIGI